MKEVKITAKNKKGEDALREHWKSSMKLGRLHKFTFKKMGYKQNVISEKPFTISLQVTNPYFQAVLKSKNFVEQIQEAMKINGAGKKDYNIEVVMNG